jgi:hypothetical protein
VIATARDHALALRAFREWQRGELQAALQLLQRTRPQDWWSLLAVEDPLMNWSFPRYMRAELLFRLGRFDDALPWYDGLGAELRMIGSYRPIRHLRLAQIRERGGDTERAGWHYQRVLVLLDGADTDWLGIRQEAEHGLLRVR